MEQVSTLFFQTINGRTPRAFQDRSSGIYLPLVPGGSSDDHVNVETLRKMRLLKFDVFFAVFSR